MSRYLVTFQTKQSASVEVEAEDMGKAQKVAWEKWQEDGLEGKWEQSSPRIQTIKPLPEKK